MSRAKHPGGEAKNLGQILADAGRAGRETPPDLRSNGEMLSDAFRARAGGAPRAEREFVVDVGADYRHVGSVRVRAGSREEAERLALGMIGDVGLRIASRVEGSEAASARCESPGPG